MGPSNLIPSSIANFTVSSEVMEKGSLEGGGWVEEGLGIWDLALFFYFF